MDEELKAITEWNINHIIGTKVIVTKQSGATFKTHTTSEATLLGGVVPIIWVEITQDYYLLCDVKAIPENIS